MALADKIETVGGEPQIQERTMQLGAFSISLAVKDIAASRAFYEKLGFTVFGGDQAHRWLIMKSGTTLIGLFQGMFEKNMLTFNPGWDSDAKPVPGFERAPHPSATGGAGPEPGAGGGRFDAGPRVHHADGPGRQPHPDRPARLTTRG
jgi:catechol 2,3-dioxygenase-like lactoylglutathione lyase family enzyme